MGDEFEDVELDRLPEAEEELGEVDQADEADDEMWLEAVRMLLLISHQQGTIKRFEASFADVRIRSRGER